MLVFWVIYRSPSDYPGLWILRPQWISDNERGKIFRHPIACVCQSLAQARVGLDPNLTLLQRPGEDPDPAIYEVWV